MHRVGDCGPSKCPLEVSSSAKHRAETFEVQKLRWLPLEKLISRRRVNPAVDDTIVAVTLRLVAWPRDISLSEENGAPRILGSSVVSPAN